MSVLDGMARVNLMMLGGMGPHSDKHFVDGVARITQIVSGNKVEYFFKDMAQAIHNIVHNVEVDEQAIWADVGENPNTKVVEPYIHFMDLGDLYNSLDGPIRFILTDSHGNQEELRLDWLPFTQFHEPLI